MRKLTKKSLDELAMIMPAILDGEQRSIIGGTGVYGDKDCPYTQAQYEEMAASGTWTGGYVEGWGYTTADAEVTGNKNTTYSIQDYQPSGLPSEGIGMNGGFFINGGVRIEDGKIFVGVNGCCPIQGVKYSGEIELIIDGRVVETCALRPNSNGSYITSGYSEIGSAYLDKSQYITGDVQVRLKVSYSYDTGGTGYQSPTSYNEVIYIQKYD